MTDSQKWLVLALIIFSGWLLYLLKPILMPFAFAGILAYLGDPLADRLEAAKLSRTNAVIIVFTAMVFIVAFILVLLIPRIESQIASLLSNLPSYIKWFEATVVPWLQNRFGLELNGFNLDKMVAMVKGHWQNAGGVASTMLGSLSRSGLAIVAWGVNLVLIPVITFYLLRDWDILVAKIHDLLPRRVAPVVSKLAEESDGVLGAFFRGQLSVMLVLGIFYSVGLWLVGLDLALLVGMLAGLVGFVPYLGAIVGIGSACIAAMVQFHDVMQLIPIAVVFGIGQAMEGMWLTPWLVGDKIGLHPVSVIFAVMAGGQLFGFLGVLLALPIASIIMVLLRHAHDLYKGSPLYGDDYQTIIQNEKEP